MATEKPRYSITVEEEMLEEIESFRYENRFQTRTQATIKLIQIGIETLKKMEVQGEPPLKYSGIRKSDGKYISDIPQEDIDKIYEGLVQLPKEDIRDLNLFIQFLTHKRKNNE